MVLKSFSSEYIIDYSPVEISSVTLCESTLCNAVTETSAQILAIMSKNMKGKKIFLACNAANKHGLHYMVKLILFWDFNSNELIVYQIDANAFRRTNLETVIAIDFSLKKVDSSTKTTLNNLSLDAGIISTASGLLEELKKLSRFNSLFVLLATCSLYGLNLVFSNPVTNLIGKGGVNNCNVMQLMYLPYEIEHEWEYDEFKYI